MLSLDSISIGILILFSLHVIFTFRYLHSSATIGSLALAPPINAEVEIFEGAKEAINCRRRIAVKIALAAPLLVKPIYAKSPNNGALNIHLHKRFFSVGRLNPLVIPAGDIRTTFLYKAGAKI